MGQMLSIDRSGQKEILRSFVNYMTNMTFMTDMTHLTM